MSSLGRLVVVTIMMTAGCGGDREAGETTTSSSSTHPATTTSTTFATTTLLPTTAPAATSAAATTSVVPSAGASLRSILAPYENRAIVESNGFWQEFEFDRCWKMLPAVRDAGDPPVDQQDVVARGDVFTCYLHTDPPADVLNNFYVIVLDDSGTAWANGGGTDGSFFIPAIPSGLLCREYLAHPDFVSSMGSHGPEDPARVSWWIDNDWAYVSVLAYWFINGQPARMDVDQNGVPCELLFDPATVARVWAGNRP